jgi:hypothetical protein
LKAAIENRIVLCLAEPEWLHLPFFGSSKTELDLLHDIALSIPILLVRTTTIVQHAKRHRFRQDEHDTSTSAQSCPSPAVLELIEEYEALLSRMQNWLYSFTQKHPGPLYWSKKDPLQHTDAYPSIEVDVHCIPTFTETAHQLRFPNGQIAGIFADIWSYQLELLLGLIELEQSPAARGCYLEQLELHYSSALEKALKILDTVPYLNSCFEGSISAEAHLKTVRRYFTLVKDKV